MAAQELVLVDTCMWIQFFNRPQSREKVAIDQLIDEDRAAFIGPLLTERLHPRVSDDVRSGMMHCVAALQLAAILGKGRTKVTA